ncbi:hypothetical protein WBP06_17905 [Novosphingobium sp. BL-8H]|uniref:hypothetical protein n=1 Tax=Novosphingobium sp. BL-8H TaxID=3127640 RepID=UPI00375710FE
MIRAKARLLPLFLAAGLAACSSASQYPSLAYRPVERATPVAPDPSDAVAPLPPPSADLSSRIDGILATAGQADSAFAAKRPVAERAVSAAGAKGTDSWLNAQVAVSTLQASRDPAVAALAELDTMFAAARDASPDRESPSAQSIDAARGKVQAQVDAQDAVVAGLDARLGN